MKMKCFKKWLLTVIFYIMFVIIILIIEHYNESLSRITLYVLGFNMLIKYSINLSKWIIK